MGALQLSQLCHQLEERARQNDSSDLPDLIGRIGSEYLTVRGLFNAERQLFIS
ncbi:hypothetical protein ALP29_200594 [Pseudomonas syringae pv. avii]|nr:hypothetical protein ALP29_200594 [Pseudomonas syringae pv. avii]